MPQIEFVQYLSGVEIVALGVRLDRRYECSLKCFGCVQLGRRLAVEKDFALNQLNEYIAYDLAHVHARDHFLESEQNRTLDFTLLNLFQLTVVCLH